MSRVSHDFPLYDKIILGEYYPKTIISETWREVCGDLAGISWLSVK